MARQVVKQLKNLLIFDAASLCGRRGRANPEGMASPISAGHDITFGGMSVAH